MIELEQLQIIAQLIDNMEIATQRMEKAYAKKQWKGV